MQLKFVLIMLKSRGQFAGTVDATAIDHHHHLFLGRTKSVHHLVDILTEFVGIKMGHKFIEDARGTVLHGPHDMEQHTASDTTPAAVALPGLTFETFLDIDLALTQQRLSGFVGVSRIRYISIGNDPISKSYQEEKTGCYAIWN